MQLKLLNRIATVKDDGTVEFDVPGDVEPQALGVGSGKTFGEVDEEPLDDSDLQYIPPMQIVMLIVGTRGDVQPFVAIGKKLQVYHYISVDFLRCYRNALNVKTTLKISDLKLRHSKEVCMIFVEERDFFSLP